jgi:hypothetical protein
MGADHVINLKTETLTGTIETLPSIRVIAVTFDAVGHPSIFEELRENKGGHCRVLIRINS